MRMPHLNLSPVTMSNTYGHYLLVRLQAVPEVAEVLTYFVTVRTDIKTAIDAYNEAVLARQAAIAVRDFHNDKLDEEIRILAFSILGRIRNNRSAPIFRNYFPRGYSEVLQVPILEQRRRSVVLLEKLSSEPDEVISSRLEPFRVQLEAFEQALANYEEARDDEARMRGNREAAKLIWLEGYRRTFQQLQNFYSGDPRQAENFFRRIRPRSTAAGEEELADFETETNFDEPAALMTGAVGLDPSLELEANANIHEDGMPEAIDAEAPACAPEEMEAPTSTH